MWIYCTVHDKRPRSFSACYKLHCIKTLCNRKHLHARVSLKMSLYHEAAQILTTASEHGGSLKSIVFGKKDWKTDRKTLFALSTEAAKWSEVLSEVIEKSDTLRLEKQVSIFLASSLRITPEWH